MTTTHNWVSTTSSDSALPARRLQPVEETSITHTCFGDVFVGTPRELAQQNCPACPKTANTEPAAETPSPSSPLHSEIHVELTGHDGNAFAVLGAVVKALRKGGFPDDAIAYQQEAMSGSYDHLLVTSMSYVDVS